VQQIVRHPERRHPVPPVGIAVYMFDTPPQDSSSHPRIPYHILCDRGSRLGFATASSVGRGRFSTMAVLAGFHLTGPRIHQGDEFHEQRHLADHVWIRQASWLPGR
jgi:hypothetical protein